jgi:hypothetical protein
LAGFLLDGLYFYTLACYNPAYEVLLTTIPAVAPGGFNILQTMKVFSPINFKINEAKIS